MEITTVTNFRQHMRAYFDKVFYLKVPLFITRSKGDDMVIMSKSEYDSMQETFHLLRSPKNAELLLKAIKEDKGGNGITYQIED